MFHHLRVLILILRLILYNLKTGDACSRNPCCKDRKLKAASPHMTLYAMEGVFR